MSDMLSKRQEAILIGMAYGREYVAADIAGLLRKEAPSSATLRRDMEGLETAGYVARRGAKRGTTYGKTVAGALFTPYDAHAYFSQDERARVGLSGYCFDILASTMPPLFSDEERRELEEATTAFTEKSERGSDVASRELERFVIELSWKSSKIEGNTYTLLDTERLIRDGIVATGHSPQEARMILNHKDAFSFTLRERAQTLTPPYVEEVHKLLVRDLDVAHGLRRGEVGITGTSYRPLGIMHQLREELTRLCEQVNKAADPYSKALLALVGISYLQPFADGNKRTARLVANALLIADGHAPLSYRTTDEVLYKESMLTFYEQLSLVPMKRIFTEQYLFACNQYLKI